MEKLSLADLFLDGKKVLMRVDFNVPLDSDLNVLDATRIQAALPSIQYVLDRGGTLILMSHLGRPHGMTTPDFSLKPCIHVLSTLLKQDVQLAPDCISEKTQEMVSRLQKGQVLLLENVRFYRAEEHPEENGEFVKILASYADYYVNDAFGSAHRRHSSIVKLPKLFPGKAAAGFLLEKEINFLGNALENPERPFYAIMGGAKIGTKIGLIKALLEKVDGLLVGGGMAYTFLKAQGFAIGDSICEDDLLSVAKAILEKADQKKIPLLFPLDLLAAKSISEDALSECFEVEKGLPEGYQGVDIGPKTIAAFCQFLQKGKTVLWNGPVGVYEFDAFSEGTRSIALALKDLQALTIVGGGDSIAAINAIDAASQISHISTGGGATLEYIEHGTLPGIEVLSIKAPVNR